MAQSSPAVLGPVQSSVRPRAWADDKVMAGQVGNCASDAAKTYWQRSNLFDRMMAERLMHPLYALEDLGAPVGGWRPIETAPEGEDILLWTPSGQLVGYQWKRGRWHASGVKASHEDCDVALFEAPTHWMPKPADPVGAASTLA